MISILLVDDREDNLLSIETLLERDGYRFVKAKSGREALKILLTETDFALILMDVEMPNLNGFETASMIYARDKLKHIPIIFITAHSFGDENVFKGYESGAVDYIYKPINPALMRAKVSVFVELYRKTRLLVAHEAKLTAINRNLENEIRERKLSEDNVRTLNLQLLQNIDKLEAANKDLDRFAFMASHDLQEPLRKIRIFTERLSHRLNGKMDEESVSYLDRIQRGTERMQNLIKDIMTFSRMSNDNGPFVDSDLNLLVGDVLVELEEIIREKSAKVELGQLPVMKLKPRLIHPLFYNLLNNAIKYSRKDVSPEIKIYSETISTMTAGNVTRSRRFCRIFIEDNGIGFEQKYSEQIFEMFKRLHHHNEYEGTGVGLTLCKKIVEEHNGYIAAKSKPGKGSTFIITFPYQQEEFRMVKKLQNGNTVNGFDQAEHA